MEIERRHVQLGTARVHYQQVGSGSPLVLIHGLSGSSRWWRRNLHALSDVFHVYVIDLIGFGRSRGEKGFILQEAAGYLRRWMERLGLESAHVVGHSLGGIIAIDLAVTFPGRVRKLVLVEPAIIERNVSVVEHFARLLRALWYLPVNFLPVLVQDAWRAGPVNIMRAARELLTTSISAKLRYITVPTLAIWGARDTAVPLDVGRRLIREVPGASLAVISGAGHTPMWDRPDAFNRLVLRFLSQPPT